MEISIYFYFGYVEKYFVGTKLSRNAILSFPTTKQPFHPGHYSVSITACAHQIRTTT